MFNIEPTSSSVPTRPISRRQVLHGAGVAAAGLAGVTLFHTAPLHARESGADRLHDAMRMLWEDHITWTRLFIVSFIAGLPDLDAAAQRLLQNQTDLGNAVTPFYGEATGAALTELLREHILGAAALLAAAKAGDATGIGAAQAAWYANADAIATTLHDLNPRHWPLAEMTQMMRDHLDLTLAEATARLNGDWAADIAAYDRIHTQILHMADMLTSGLVGQFPRIVAKL
jgi:hypothetical protein